MATPTAGIHHITVIASDPQRNYDFYTGLLGLRLVKTTVHFDVPDVYHLYYGDDAGSPGTILTFFPFPDAPRGKHGAGQVASISFAVPTGALEYWASRLLAHDVEATRAQSAFDGETLAFRDHDGLELELVAAGDPAAPGGWTAGPVPHEHAIRGFHHATLMVRDQAPTARLLTETFGLRKVAEAGNLARYQTVGEGIGTLVDVWHRPDAEQVERVPLIGLLKEAGTVNHLAWRAVDDAAREAYRPVLTAQGFEVSIIKDRDYFRSIYFLEPGGIRFEIATDPPGFATDEDPEHLGEDLKIPKHLEHLRDQYDQILQPLKRLR